jgi:predicted nucleotidyltransferase component of viral defense system
MLNKKDLELYTNFPDPYQVEKDYLQDMLLGEIYSKKFTSNSLVFKGGTALSKFYNSGRFSEDLDFNILANGSSTSELATKIEHVLLSAPYKPINLQRPSINKFETLTLEISFQGPRYNGKLSTLQHISLEINTKSNLKYKPIPMVKRPIYKDMPDYTVLVMDSREILTEKVRAIMSKTRKHKERDLYDIYFLLGKKTKLDKNIVLEKLKESEMKFTKGDLLSNINGIADKWVQLEPFLSQKLLSYKETKISVIEGLKNADLL